jgi:Ca2+ transporting ATPase
MFAGTDIAKEASDIIIIDNNFSSIVVAIIYGRNIYDNIRKFLQFQLTVNFCACLLVFICACIGNDSPLTTIQMLWINLIMDSLGSLALATESPYDELLDREPTKRDESIINGKMWKHIAIQSLVELILLLILYLRAPHFIKENDVVRLAENNIIKYCYGEMPGNISEKNIIFGTETKWGSKVKLRGGMTEEDCGKYAEKQDLSVAFELYINVNGATTHMTLLFNIFVIYTLFNQINCRVIDDSFNIFVRIKKNFFFPCITLGELVLQIILVQFGKEAFKVTERGLSFKQWLISIGFSLITFALSASIKRIPLDVIIQKFLDKNVKNNKIANIDDLVVNNGSTINIGNSNYVEKNDINLSIDKETNNTVKRDDSRKKSESFIQKNLMKRRSISKGGSLRANKADVNFSNNN